MKEDGKIIVEIGKGKYMGGSMLAITGKGIIVHLEPFLSPSTSTSFLGPDCQTAKSLGLSLLLNL